MTIQQCRYIVEIAIYGTFNEAAKRLFIAQSSLSSAVKELENELGITIFERSKRGISITLEGAEFLEYAKQMLAQADLIENRYHKKNKIQNRFSISSQHYDFATEAFAKLMKVNSKTNYDYRFLETKTYKVIENVKSFGSEIGILYINDFNSKVMNRYFADHDLEFHSLFQSYPHIFVGENHPLSSKKLVSVEELKDYPYITFEQDKSSSIQFAEEVFNFTQSTKQIRISDRATLLNLLTEMDGYTIGSGVVVSYAQKKELKAIPLEVDQIYTVGWIAHKGKKLSMMASDYIRFLNDIIHN